MLPRLSKHVITMKKDYKMHTLMSKGGAKLLSVSIKTSLSMRGDHRSNRLVCVQLERRTEGADNKLLLLLKKFFS